MFVITKKSFKHFFSCCNNIPTCCLRFSFFFYFCSAFCNVFLTLLFCFLFPTFSNISVLRIYVELRAAATATTNCVHLSCLLVVAQRTIKLQQQFKLLKKTTKKCCICNILNKMFKVKTTQKKMKEKLLRNDFKLW